MAQYDGSHITRIERQMSSPCPELPFIPQRMYQVAALKRVLRQYSPQVHLILPLPCREMEQLKYPGVPPEKP